MFNLEQSIAGWRQQLSVAGVRTPEILDELESHLREVIGQQIKSDRNEHEAFETAVRQLGRVEQIKDEYNKILITPPGELMKRIIIIGNGIAGILIGMALVMPALAQHRHMGAMTTESAVALIIGFLLTVGGAGSAWCGFKLRRA